MEKKKIIFIVHQLNFGGVQKALLSVLDAVDYEKNDVTLYIRKNRIDLIDKVNKNVGKIIVNDDKTNYYRRPVAALLAFYIVLLKLFRRDISAAEEKLRRLVIRSAYRYEKKHFFSDGIKYDTAISYIQGYTAEFTADYVEAERKIVFFHDSEDNTHEIHMRVFPEYEKIVTVNAGCRDVIASFYPEFNEKIIPVENFADELTVLSKSREKRDIKKKGITLCSCGRFAPVKGYDLAVDAAGILKKAGLEFIWYFVGDGPERAALEEKISAAGLDENIIITGMLKNPYPYVAACDIFIQPSRAEAHPLSIIEAQILTRPVISTPTVGGKFLIKNDENGLLSDFSSEDIARKILVLAGDERLREKMSAVLAGIDYEKKRKIYAEAINALL